MGGSVIDQFPFKCWLCETPSSETLSALKSVSQVTRNWSQRENSRKCYCVPRCFSPSIPYLEFQETNRHHRYRFRPNCDIWFLCLAKASLKCISRVTKLFAIQTKCLRAKPITRHNSLSLQWFAHAPGFFHWLQDFCGRKHWFERMEIIPILATWKWCSKASCCKIQMQCL